jgi:hypothetical protein
MKILGIDFSYSSAGLTLYDNLEYKHFALVNKAVFSRSKTKTLNDIFKDSKLLSTLKDYNVVLKLVDREPISIPPKIIKDKETKKKIQNPAHKWDSISEWHRKHHSQSRQWSQTLMEIIDSMELLPGDKIILENYDFGKRGSTDNIVQMVEHTYALKQRIFEKYPEVDFYLASSTEIKKIAGSGNYTKYDMYTSFIKEDVKSSLLEFLKNEDEKLYIKNEDIILSPVNDIVDSYFAVKYLQDKMK